MRAATQRLSDDAPAGWTVNGPQFFQTIIGRTYFERTLPGLVEELARLNRNLEKLIEMLGKDERAQEKV